MFIHKPISQLLQTQSAKYACLPQKPPKFSVVASYRSGSAPLTSNTNPPLRLLRAARAMEVLHRRGRSFLRFCASSQHKHSSLRAQSPFFRSLCLPHLASARSQQRHAVLGLDSGVCLRWSGGSLVDPRFRLAASSPPPVCSHLHWTKNVSAGRGKSWRWGQSN